MSDATARPDKAHVRELLHAGQDLAEHAGVILDRDQHLRDRVVAAYQTLRGSRRNSGSMWVTWTE